MMSSPIKNEVGGIFIPVRDIEEARDWYCHILGLPNDGEVLFGHLYILPMAKGSGVVLDSKIYAENAVFKVPAFHFNTDNVTEAYDYMLANGVQMVSTIQHDQYFNFKDMDGNMLMVCKC